VNNSFSWTDISNYEISPITGYPSGRGALIEANWIIDISAGGLAAGLLRGGGQATIGEASKWLLGASKTEAKWASQMAKRGWTPEMITEALTKGKSYNAINLINKANSATRYVHPTTGQSVIIDDMTREVIHVGGPGFKYY
jgi:hypothetical protein